jgi:hypothetical protein
LGESAREREERKTGYATDSLSVIS